MSHEHPPEWSLKKEIRKRQTQQTQRTTEVKRTVQVPPTGNPITTSQPVLSPSVPATNRLGGKTGDRSRWLRRHWRSIGLSLGVLSLLMAILWGISLLVSPAPPTPTTTWPALPTSNVSTAVTYLKQTGFLVLDMQPHPMPDTNFRANQAIQIDLQQGTQHGLFFLLSYDTSNEVSADMMRLSSNSTFKQWGAGQFANLLLLAAPDDSTPFIAQVSAALNQQFVVPYRGFMLTPSSH